MIYIHADESCLGNQFSDRDSPGGAAGMIEYWRTDRWERRDYWIAEPSTTNNRMALRSAIEGLGALKSARRVIFTSDSSYLVKGMREWVHGWIRRGWRRKGGAVGNVDLWKELVRIASRHEIDWRWIRGHAGHPQNEYADWLATRAARTQRDSGGLVDSGYEAWLDSEREQHERYLDVFEFQPPEEDTFTPARRPVSAR